MDKEAEILARIDRLENIIDQFLEIYSMNNELEHDDSLKVHKLFDEMYDLRRSKEQE